MNTQRKGFTLIEITILLTIIGTLSIFMAVMDINAQSSSRANHIINDFRNLKTAALSWQKDNHTHGNHDPREILSYLNSKSTVKLVESHEDENGYMLHVADGGRSWYVGRELKDSKIKGKLTAKANTLKLLGNDMKSVYNNDSQVWVQVFTVEI